MPVRYNRFSHHSCRESDGTGIGLINYYQKVARITMRQREKLNSIELSEEMLKDLRIWWPGIELTRLPRGLDSQAFITVELVPEPG
jgi:hypothetical protein